MGEVKDLLLKTYLRKGAKNPTESKKVDEPKSPAVKVPLVKKPRTIGDISIAIRAQQIYNPQAPPAPPMKPPTKPMLEQGTAPAMTLDNSFLGNK